MKRFVLSAAVVLAAGAVSLAQQRQPGGTRGGMGNASLMPMVVSNKDLQAELKVTDAQKDKFKDVAAKLADVQKKQRELFTGGGRPDQTKMQEVRTEMTKANEDATKAVTDALTADQRKRVKQLEVQRMGLRAFVKEEVLKELKLTDEQKTKIKAITDEVQKELGTGGRGAGGAAGGRGQADPAALAEAAKKRAKATAKGVEKVSAELTDEQKKAWKELTGEKFDLSKLTARAPMRDQ